jgi:proline iminopeptidase
MTALEHAVDYPGAAAQSIIVCGVPARRYFDSEYQRGPAFEPAELREQFVAAREAIWTVQSREDCQRVWREFMPYEFANPRDPRLAAYLLQWDQTLYTPQAHHLPTRGPFEVESHLDSVSQPVLVIGGRYDRDCVVEASEAIARGLPNAELVIFEHSGHFVFVEEPERFLEVVQDFLARQV